MLLLQLINAANGTSRELGEAVFVAGANRKIGFHVTNQFLRHRWRNQLLPRIFGNFWTFIHVDK